MKKPILLLFTILFCLNYLKAQWIQTSGPAGGNVSCIAYNETTIFSGTNYGGVLTSNNNGVTWNSTYLKYIMPSAIATNGATVVIGALDICTSS
ncbi:MAG TPA: hypothetical protein PL028_04885 [Bacteroidales bacterium]|nr:hypothetical protein [Bacteroidales bacterium]